MGTTEAGNRWQERPGLQLTRTTSEPARGRGHLSRSRRPLPRSDSDRYCLPPTPWAPRPLPCCPPPYPRTSMSGSPTNLPLFRPWPFPPPPLSYLLLFILD